MKNALQRLAMRHKVLLCIPHLKQGGAERQILELARRLPERFEVSLCVFEGDDDIHYRELLDGTRRHVLDSPGAGPQTVRRLADLLRRERPEILHAYRDKTNLVARLAAMLAPVPIVIVNYRNCNLNPSTLMAERLMGGRADAVLANSIGIKQELVRRAGVRPERIQVIHNFVDLDKFRPPSIDERAAARRAFDLGADEIATVLPGRISLQKHQIGLARSLHVLERRGGLPDNALFLLPGRVRDRIFAPTLRALIKAYRLERHMRLLEPLPDSGMVTLYHAADALVMPSLYEGLCNAVLEAHASGLPAVVSHAANHDGIVVGGDTGFEVPTLRHAALADALGRLLALSGEERRRMGARGREHVIARFSPQRVLAETVTLYDSLLARKGLA